MHRMVGRVTQPSEPELLTTGQAARALGVRSVNTVKQWVRQGTLEGVRRGSRLLVLRSSVDRLRDEGKVGHGASGDAARERDQDVLSDLRRVPEAANPAERAAVIDSTTAEIRRRAAPTLQKHGISRAFLFGSAVRGDVHARSDIDIAMEVPRDSDMDLIEFVELGLELEATLGRKVDLVNLATMKPRIKERAEKEQVSLL